ncbi:MAG: YeeE/YedE thiosulfate transporter family protein [Desulfobulbaceae bacterium]
MGGTIKELYNKLCKKEWDPTITGIMVALLSILIAAWWRPWGAVGAVRNWGDWILYGLNIYSDPNTLEVLGFIDEDGASILSMSFWYNTGSVIGFGFVGGAFISACMGGQFALRFPPIREWVKAVIAGILMGIGATFAGGCNVGGLYNALGNLSAHGFAMWFGLTFGVLFGLWLLYKEMEHITWGSGGAKTIDFPVPVQFVVGLAVIAAMIWGAYSYANYDGDEAVEYINSLPGMLLIAAALGYTMQRGRWCMVQGFREPHMTGNATMAKSVALSIAIVAVGTAVLKYGVPQRADGNAVLAAGNYVRGTFGWGGVFGGFTFGLGAMLAGGCGTGTLWRVGEGQLKLWLAMIVFALSTSVTSLWVKSIGWEASYEEGEAASGVIGKAVYLPDFIGYGGSLALILFAMAAWYVVVSWNEESNKLILPM